MSEAIVGRSKSLNAPKNVVKSKNRAWTLLNTETRNVANYLNGLSKAGSVVFGVYQSMDVGGTYAVLSYKDVSESEDTVKI